MQDDIQGMMQEEIQGIMVWYMVDTGQGVLQGRCSMIHGMMVLQGGIQGGIYRIIQEIMDTKVMDQIMDTKIQRLTK